MEYGPGVLLGHPANAVFIGVTFRFIGVTFLGVL